MKEKKNPIVIAIIILMIMLITIIYLYINPIETNIKVNNLASSDTVEAEATIKTIENTLSSSGQISSGLNEKIYLHASYYFEEILVDENIYVKEGTNIIKYTNGTYLTAPYDCVIVSSEIPLEDEICTTSHYIEIKSIETLCMNLSVSEADINKINIGDIVNITMSASNEKIEGYITSISEIGTYSSSGSYFAVVVSFENNGNLKIGMSATCEIVIEKAENVITVPIEAIQTLDNGEYVVVVNSDGSTMSTKVETGISNDAYIEIKSGISEGTRVQLSEVSNSSNSFNVNSGRMNMKEFNKGFEKYDVILTPTASNVAFDLGSKINNPLEMYLSDLCTVPVNIAGLPAISIPCGLNEKEKSKRAENYFCSYYKLKLLRDKKKTDFSICLFWLGWVDSNYRNARVKVWCLTAWLQPNIKYSGVEDGTRTHGLQCHKLTR